jgi:aspartate--ammonia ligase
MKNNIIVKNYNSILNIHDTQIAIKLVKDTFENELSKVLDLTRVTAPLFVEPTTGLNDDLSGIEKAVSFKAHYTNSSLEIVQSLAKWKRNALHKYSCSGIYTDMNAIRPFEELDNIHSLYVDQWDWEKVVTKEERNIEYLKSIVKKIYGVLLKTCETVHEHYPEIEHDLPNDITFITTEELEERYPSLSSKERENEIAKLYKAVFLMKIGDKLNNGEKHDGRAPDYDDWELNGDILLYNEVLDVAFEVSSMGIRVSEESLKKQLEKANCLDRLSLPFHNDLVEGKLPYTIGGGLGQSRICMFMLSNIAALPMAQIFVGYDTELCKLTVRGFHLFSFSFLISGFCMFGSCLFTALNDGIVSAIISFMRTFVFQCSAILIMPFLIGIDGVWWSVTAAEAGAFAVTFIFTIMFRKKYKYM